MAKYFSSEVTKDILIRKKVLTLTNIPAIKLRERERERAARREEQNFRLGYHYLFRRSRGRLYSSPCPGNAH